MRRKITYDPTRDYYEILGIATHATDDTIRQAYRQRVREVHPDLNPDRQEWATLELQRVNEAYDALSDPARRRDYDRLRWPHVPSQPRQERRYRSPFSAPDYDFNRPWWEQVAKSAYPFADDLASTAPNHAHAPRAGVGVARWLRIRGLGTTWTTLVGLWRSPYAWILSVLGTLLALDVAVIAYISITPQEWDDVQAWVEAHSGPVSSRMTDTATPVPPPLFLVCADPAVQISAPRTGGTVRSAFAVSGTAQHPQMWTYRIEIGYLGAESVAAYEPPHWIEVRSPPRNQSSAEPPITDGVLTDTPVNLRGQPAGYYAIRLRVTLRDGNELRPCDVVVRRF